MRAGVREWLRLIAVHVAYYAIEAMRSVRHDVL
jgi:hypothetical protein